MKLSQLIENTSSFISDHAEDDKEWLRNYAKDPKKSILIAAKFLKTGLKYITDDSSQQKNLQRQLMRKLDQEIHERREFTITKALVPHYDLEIPSIVTNILRIPSISSYRDDMKYEVGATLSDLFFFLTDDLELSKSSFAQEIIAGEHLTPFEQAFIPFIKPAAEKNGVDHQILHYHRPNHDHISDKELQYIFPELYEFFDHYFDIGNRPT